MSGVRRESGSHDGDVANSLYVSLFLLFSTFERSKISICRRFP
jgi:hypothetical protein